MKKTVRIFLLAAFVLLKCSLRLQGVKISNQGGIPDSSAVLELHSQNQGLFTALTHNRPAGLNRFSSPRTDCFKYQHRLFKHVLRQRLAAGLF